MNCSSINSVSSTCDFVINRKRFSMSHYNYCKYLEKSLTLITTLKLFSLSLDLVSHVIKEARMLRYANLLLKVF